MDVSIPNIKKNFSQAIKSALPSHIYLETFGYRNNTNTGKKTPKKTIPVFINTEKNAESLFSLLEQNFYAAIKNIEEQSGKIFKTVRFSKTISNTKKHSIEDIKLITVFLRSIISYQRKTQTIYVFINFRGFTNNPFLDEVFHKLYVYTSPTTATLIKVDQKRKITEYKSNISLGEFSYSLSDAISIF